MVKLVDTRDLKSLDGNIVPVRFRLRAPNNFKGLQAKITACNPFSFAQTVLKTRVRSQTPPVNSKAKLYYNPDDCLGFMTFTTSRLLSTCLHKEISKAGLDLTSEQWGTLMRFWNNECLTQDELALTSCVDKSSISRALSVMERRGLIIRTVDPVDSRRKNIRLSEEANTLKREALAAVKATISRAFAEIPRQEQVTCFKVLAKVKKNLQQKK